MPKCDTGPRWSQAEQQQDRTALNLGLCHYVTEILKSSTFSDWCNTLQVSVGLSKPEISANPIWKRSKQSRWDWQTVEASTETGSGHVCEGGWGMRGRCHILQPCRVIYLRYADDTAEDSEMQGHRPGPLYKLQETLKTGDKWPEWPGHRLCLNMRTSSPCTLRTGRQDLQAEKVEQAIGRLYLWNLVINSVFMTKTEGVLKFGSLTHFYFVLHHNQFYRLMIFKVMRSLWMHGIRQYVLNKYGVNLVLSETNFQCLIKSEREILKNGKFCVEKVVLKRLNDDALMLVWLCVQNLVITQRFVFKMFTF